MAGRRLRMVAGVVGTGALALTSLVGGSPAGAAPMTPTGQCGAANMRNAGGAMTDAMTLHTNYRGDLGMVAAVIRTACS